ncbi:MAG: thioredoxin family protein [Bdellovibrionales bacterium]
MALTYTPAGELGSTCPDFKLPSVDGRTFARKDFAAAKALVVMFICNHCPYVQAIEERLLKLAHEMIPRGAAFVGICANDPSDYPEDRPEALLKRWKDLNYGFPYLLDESQSVAKEFGAVCTPDIYVYDSTHKLRYRGRLDDSWRNSQLVRREELKIALERIMQNLPVEGVQNPSMGCSIKWKKG